MKKFQLHILLVICLAIYSCKTDKTDTLKTTQIDNSLFNALDASARGLDFANNLSSDSDNNILDYLYYYNGGGVAIGDINNDGLEDIFLTANEGPDKLFLNEGKLKFKDISITSGITASNTWSSGVSMDDINGDGFLDIYVCKVDPVTSEKTHNLVYINNGDLSFTEKAEEYGLDFSGYSTQVSFLDYDKDGDLDMYLANHSVHSVRSYGRVNLRDKKDPLAGDRFFENKLNEAEKKFVDVTDKVGIYSSPLGYALSVISTDINNDGYPDIYVANDFHENDYIYINTKNKSFVETTADKMNHTSKFSMGVDIADMNNDGLVDIFTTDMLPYDKRVALRSGGEDTDEVFKIRKDFGFEDQYARNHFQLQTQYGQFNDIALMSKTYATDWSWSVLLQDFDNNGLNDIFISNGIVKRPNDLDYINFLNQLSPNKRENIADTDLDKLLDIMPSEKLPNFLFTQEAPMQFSALEKSKATKPSFSNGAAYADLDLDGDLDLVINNINDPVSLLENTSSGNNYISFQLKGENTVKHSKVKLYLDGKCVEKDYNTTRGYQSSSSHKIHFGLGENTTVDSVVVYWPNGTKQNIGPQNINTHHVLNMRDANSKYKYQDARNLPKYERLDFKHIENEFSDYNEDKLIPELLSREGPAVISADFNGDKIPDLFVGGARFQSSRLYMGNRNGIFKRRPSKDFENDSKYEDIDAAVIDFDKDGDLDLYVVSGGNDVKELNKILEDRIYLNDGKGNLKRLPLSLPHTNGSTVSIADVNNDGFEDIFVGARSIPTAYGLSPYSFILMNKGGFGVDIMHKERYGMVTDSEWADVDNDGDPDLVLCGDWMGISIQENDGAGKFSPSTKKIEHSSGMWNTIHLHDVNGDGKLDILAGNAGANFKWSASAEHPMELYVADFDKNGQTESIILSDYFGDKKLFNSLDKLSKSIPSIKKQYLNYAPFSEITEISDINLFSEDNMAESKIIEELRSMLYLSTDTGFEGIALPYQAQMSTIQDILVDNHNQILFVGNHHEYITELGKSMSNSGGILSNFNADKKQYLSYNSLDLPYHSNNRKIIQISDGRFFVAPNNDKGLFLRVGDED